MSSPKFGIGQSIRRKEDDPLLRGRGRYVADDPLPNQAYGAFVRSPHAFARCAEGAGAFICDRQGRLRSLPMHRLSSEATYSPNFGIGA